MPIWILYAILGGLSSTTANFLHRFVLRKGDDPTAYAWFYELILLVASCFLMINNFRLELSLQSFTALSLLGFTELISVYLYMKMHSYSHLSISTIISRTRLIWVPIIAFFLFQESLTSVQYIGIAILFLGLSITVSPKKIIHDKGIFYSFMAAIGTAFVTSFLKLSSQYASVPVVTAAMTIPAIIFIPLLIKNPLKRISETVRTNTVGKIGGGVANIISSFFLVMALSLGSASIVTGIYQGMFVVGVLAGIFILHERQDIGKKIIGAVVTAAGVLLLTT